MVHARQLLREKRRRQAIDSFQIYSPCKRRNVRLNLFQNIINNPTQPALQPVELNSLEIGDWVVHPAN